MEHRLSILSILWQCGLKYGLGFFYKTIRVEQHTIDICGRKLLESCHNTAYFGEATLRTMSRTTCWVKQLRLHCTLVMVVVTRYSSQQFGLIAKVVGEKFTDFGNGVMQCKCAMRGLHQPRTVLYTFQYSPFHSRLSGNGQDLLVTGLTAVTGVLQKRYFREQSPLE